ncbi:hypothetical protein KKB18_05905, partial [bacterium]|nr:hypothetical protein [bacterium]
PYLGNLQDTYADLILESPDPKYIDELAFMIAHTSYVEIKRMYENNKTSSPLIFLENVEWIYKNAELLNYVELVDVGSPGIDSNFYTTTKYRYREDGVVKEYTLPMEKYYWTIVHPKLNNENIRMDTKADPQQSTYGYWWRNYLMNNPSEVYDYKKHKIFEIPNQYDIEHFNSLTNDATGHITSWENTPIKVLLDAKTKQPVLIEQKDYNGAWTGCYLVTTLPVEKMYEEGESEFLMNMLKRGYFNTPMGELPVPGIKIVIFQDVEPFGKPTNETILRALNYNVKIHSSDDFGKNEILYRNPIPIKVIISSGQPRSFYEKLAQYKDWFLDWLEETHTLEFHAAIDPEQGDWKGLEFTLGITFDDPANKVNNFEFGYYPVLKDIITPAAFLWDGEPFVHDKIWREWHGPDFNDSDFAIQAVGKWIAQIMQALVTTTMDRSLQPNQLAMLKIGMCGEMQDIMEGSFRSTLIPIESVCDYAEDHVWTELFFLDDWTFFEVWRGGMISQLGQPAGVSDKSVGGHYDISGVWRWRGDGYITDDTPRYTPTCTFYAKVVDNNGNPVDGAMVEAWSDYVWGNYIQSVYGYTDENGECSLQVGDNRRIYGKVVTKSTGTYPQENNKIELVAQNTEADITYKWETPVINTVIPQLDATEIKQTENPVGEYKLEIEYSIPYQILNAENPEDLNVFSEKLEGGLIDFFVCDEDNFNKYKESSTFEAYLLEKRSSKGSFEFITPDDRFYYLVFSNESKMVMKETVDLKINVLQKVQESWQSIETVEKNCIIPAGNRWYFKLGKNETSPKIVMAGFNPQSLSSSEGGNLQILADVIGNADKLMLYYNGMPTGIEFDITEGENTIDLTLGAGLPIGSHKIELVAKAEEGLTSSLWPYLEIADTANSSKSFNLSYYLGIEGESPDPDAPKILMAGFGNSGISATEGGYIEIIAKVDDPQGLDDIKSVELYFEGGIRTGLSLSSDEEGLYTYQTLITSKLPAGKYVFEIIAEDKEGNKSPASPYLTIY